MAQLRSVTLATVVGLALLAPPVAASSGRSHVIGCPDGTGAHGACGSVESPPTLVSLELTPPVVAPAAETRGVVTLSDPADSDTVVIIEASDTSKASADPTALVPAGQMSGSFAVRGLEEGEVEITATLHTVSVSQRLTITDDPPSLTGFVLAPVVLKPGEEATGTVSLSGLNDAGTEVAIAVEPGTAASAPASVFVLIDQYEATFRVSALTGGQETITVSLGEVSISRFLTVLAPKRVTLEAKPLRVERGARTRLVAVVSPCGDHAGDTIVFKRGDKTIARAASDASCRAVHRVRVWKVSRFRAVSPRQDDDHLAGTSNLVTVRIL
jgi:hypothetical protein